MVRLGLNQMKVAISGIGIAGPTSAYWLLRYGHEPVLIERSRGLRSGGYMIDFWGVGLTVAERMGILPQILNAGYPVQEVRFVDAKGRPEASLSTEIFRRVTHDRFTSLPRSALSTIIYRTLNDRVETIFGDQIAAIEQHDSCVRIKFTRSAPRDVDLLVGADGLHSNVRRLAFGPEDRFEKQLGYHVAASEVDGYRPRDELVYVCHTTPGRQIARFAERGDRTLFLFVFVDELLGGREPRDAQESQAALRLVFENGEWETAQILAAMDSVPDVYFDSVSQIHKDCWSNRRSVLLGDAAACVSLLAGEGCGLGMTEAYVLAGELHNAGPNVEDA